MTDLTDADLIVQARALEPLDKARTSGPYEIFTEPREGGGIDYMVSTLSPPQHPVALCGPSLANAEFFNAAPRAFTLLHQLCDRLEVLQKEATNENAWLCERGDNGPTRYVCIDPSGFFDWTDDVNKALRLCRREDADACAAIVDDCWRVAQHKWIPGVDGGHFRKESER